MPASAGSKSHWSAGQFGGARWAGSFWRETTLMPSPRKMTRCRAGPRSLLELSRLVRLGSGFGVRLCWVGGADQLG